MIYPVMQFNRLPLKMLRQRVEFILTSTTPPRHGFASHEEYFNNSTCG